MLNIGWLIVYIYKQFEVILVSYVFFWGYQIREYFL